VARRPYLTAEQACEELGVAAQTLYAYVSRGLIRSEPGTDGTRGRRYRTEDVLRLKGASARGATPIPRRGMRSGGAPRCWSRR
jgi:citrate synthase